MFADKRNTKRTMSSQQHVPSVSQSLSAGKPKKHLLRKHLTLVETLVAAAVFLIIMVLLLHIFKGSHRASLAGQNLHNIYANTNVAFDVLTQDLRSAKATSGMSADSSDDILFHQPAEDELSFITVGDPPVAAANSKILEVVYRFKDHRLERAVNHDAASGDWSYSIYGSRPDDLSSIDDDHYHTISQNLMDVEFTCLKPDGSEYASLPSQTTELPGAVRIQMTLLSRRAFQKWQNSPSERQEDIVDRHARTLSKLILLPSP